MDDSKDVSQLYFNTRSGEDLLCSIRGRGLTRIPVLVFCFYSINETRYVDEFGLAGSTTSNCIVRSYIKGLAEGKETDSVSWVGFAKHLDNE